MNDVLPTTPFVVRDGNKNLKNMGTVQDAGGTSYPQQVLRVNGAPVLDNTNPVPTATTPMASPLTNSAATTTSATIGQAISVVPFSATRRFLHIFSRTTGNETVDLGSSNVVVGGGIPLQAAGGFSFLGVGAAGPIYAVTTVANSPLSYVEG